MATSPIVETASLSKTGSQVVPLLVVFHTPPDAVPTYTIFGLLSTTAKSSMRPPITAGPISRNSRFLNLSVGFCGSPGAASVFLGIALHMATQPRIVQRALDIRFIFHPPVRKARHVTSAPLRAAMFVEGPTDPVQRQTRWPAPKFHAPSIGIVRIGRYVQLLVCHCLQIPA